MRSYLCLTSHIRNLEFCPGGFRTVISLLPPNPPATASVALIANHDASGQDAMSADAIVDTHEELNSPSQLM